MFNLPICSRILLTKIALFLQCIILKLREWFCFRKGRYFLQLFIIIFSFTCILLPVSSWWYCDGTIHNKYMKNDWIPIYSSVHGLLLYSILLYVAIEFVFFCSNKHSAFRYQGANLCHCNTITTGGPCAPEWTL